MWDRQKSHFTSPQLHLKLRGQVPGPHLLNGLLNLVDNYLQLSAAERGPIAAGEFCRVLRDLSMEEDLRSRAAILGTAGGSLAFSFSISDMDLRLLARGTA